MSDEPHSDMTNDGKSEGLSWSKERRGGERWYGRDSTPMGLNN